MSIYAEDQTAAAPGGPAQRGATPQRRPGTAAWWRDAIVVATWANVLFVLALWLRGGGAADLDSATQTYLSLGRLTGLVSADLLLIQVLLMARLPMVERVYGQDELARRHRLVGCTSFFLMVAHIVLITLGYAGQDARGALTEAWRLTVGYPGMLLAVAGTALLVMVTATSIKRARAKLRYESWHLLHLYAYLGVGLALPHQLWTGQDFLASRLATVYWWTLWAAAAGAVLIWRIGVPVYRTLRHDLRVTAVIPEGPGVVSVHMTGRQLHRLPVAAGQFFIWRFLTRPGASKGHPYSLSAAPDGRTLRITVKDLGDDSAALTRLQPGTRVAIEGPYGRLHAGARTGRKVTLIAGGIGVTPLRALLEELPQHPGDVTVIYRAHSEGDLILRTELEQLAAARGARLVYLLGPRVPGRASWLPAAAAEWSDAAALHHIVPDIATHDVYLCGATAWMDAARRAARDAGVPAARVHLERFSW
jgi:predicted ferric reductase